MLLLRGRVGALLLAASLVGCTDKDESPVAPAQPDTQPAPVVTSFSPTEGPIGGGTVVTFSGLGFSKGTTVTFGGMSATDVHVISNTVMHAIAPSHAAGDVNVVVRNPGGRNAMPSVRYRYVDDSDGCPGCWDY
jgi:IPT/TIG domain-containing protein